MNEKEILLHNAKAAEKSLDFMAKEMKNLARRLRNTDIEKLPEKFQSNVVEGTLFMNAFAMASKAFNRMLAEVDNDPNTKFTMAGFLVEEAEKLKVIEDKRIEEYKKLQKGEENAKS